MDDRITLLDDDFRDFAIGPLPFDREHSAMGEYHYVQQEGFSGRWYDPITNCNYRGPNWIVTAQDGRRFMEQMRVRNPLTHNVCPVLAAGEKDWTDYTLTVKMRALCTSEEAGVLFRYQTSLMHYAFFLCAGEAQVWKVEKKQRTLLAKAPFAYDCDTLYTLSVACSGGDFVCSVDGEPVVRAHGER